MLRKINFLLDILFIYNNTGFKMINIKNTLRNLKNLSNRKFLATPYMQRIKLKQRLRRLLLSVKDISFRHIIKSIDNGLSTCLIRAYRMSRIKNIISELDQLDWYVVLVCICLIGILVICFLKGVI